MDRLELVQKMLRTAALAVCAKGRLESAGRRKAVCKAVHLKQAGQFQESMKAVVSGFLASQLKSIAGKLRKESTPESEKFYAQKEAAHKFSCLMLEMQSELAGDLLQIGKDRIPDSDVSEEGRETWPHITILYGFHTDDSKEVLEAVQCFGPVRFTLGEISKFEGEEQDVVKIDIEGDDLQSLRKLVEKFPYTSTHKGYIPHITLSYVKKGATGFEGSFDLTGKEYTANVVVFSTSEGSKTQLDLTDNLGAISKFEKNCGTGAGGFQPGNTCAGGGDGGDGGDGGGSSRSNAANRISFGGMHVGRGEKVDEVTESWFGKKLTDDDLSGIAGAPAGSLVSATVYHDTNTDKPSKIGLTWNNSVLGGESSRIITRGYDGTLRITNAGLNIEAQKQSAGTQILAHQVKTAAALGIKEMRTVAEGPPKNGYYTWARLGYDAAIPLNMKLPDEFKGASQISDLMKTPAGRTWWKENVKQDVLMHFDLQDGSKSRSVLDAYAKAKLGTGKQDGKSAGVNGRGRSDFGRDLGQDRGGRKGGSEVADTAATLARKVFNPDDWHDKLIDAVAPVMAKSMVSAVLAQQKLMKIDIAKISKGIKNCGTGAGGFQPGNTCAGGGDGDQTAGVEYKKNATPDDFLKARSTSSRSQFLSDISADDLKGHKLILTADGKAGAAVSPDGDIQNVFNNGGPKGIGLDIMTEAVRQGGVTLDCFDGFLPGYYSNFGFEQTGRMKFNREYAPAGWDYKNDKEPDVVFMARVSKELPNDAKERFKEWKEAGGQQPEPIDRYYNGSEWDQAKSDSRRIAVGDGEGKKSGTKNDRRGNPLWHRGIQGSDRRNVKTTTATDWLNSLDGEDADRFRQWFAGMGFATEIPKWMKESIREFLAQAFEQPYWAAINVTTLTDIEGVLATGLTSGESMRDMADRIAEGLVYAGEDSDYADIRAMNIAKTESGNVLNGARSLAHDHLKETLSDHPELASQIRRVWLSILGPTTRDAHADLDGVPEDDDGMWDLNGVMCRWPSDTSLPPEDRCNCYCSTVAAFGMDDDESGGLLAEYEQRVIDRESDSEIDDEEKSVKNCGTGAGGFQPGNDCARGGGGGESARHIDVKKWAASLSPEQKGSLNGWTSVRYKEIREYEAHGTDDWWMFFNADPDGIMFSEVSAHLNEALDTGPLYKGTIYRGLKYVPDGVATELSTVGKKIEFKATSSFSKSRNVAAGFLASNADTKFVLFQLNKPKTAVEIVGLSQEKEVIARKGSQYKVVSSKPMTIQYGRIAEEGYEVVIEEVHEKSMGISDLSDRVVHRDYDESRFCDYGADYVAVIRE